MKIMFVCTGNICRSPLAEAVFEALVNERGVADRFELDSSGTTAYHEGQSPDERMRNVASRHGIRIRHRSKQLRARDLVEFDLILAMDRSNMKSIRRLDERHELLDKIRMFRDYDPEAGEGAEVPDPYYGDGDGFELVYAIVERTSRALLSELLDTVATSSS